MLDEKIGMLSQVAKLLDHPIAQKIRPTCQKSRPIGQTIGPICPTTRPTYKTFHPKRPSIRSTLSELPKRLRRTKMGKKNLCPPQSLGKRIRAFMDSMRETSGPLSLNLPK